jgi:hypothetical protein
MDCSIIPSDKTVICSQLFFISQSIEARIVVKTELWNWFNQSLPPIFDFREIDNPDVNFVRIVIFPLCLFLKF